MLCGMAENPPTASSSKWLSRLAQFLVIAGIIIGVMIYFGRKSMIGTRYKVNDNESVSYSGSATEREAIAVAEQLKTLKFFNDKGEKDVLLKKSDDEGTIVSFVVVDGAWDNQTMVRSFTYIGKVLTASLGSRLKLRMIDDNLNTKKEIPIEFTMGTNYSFTPKELVNYAGSATEADAKLLGEELMRMGFFDGENEKEVFIRKGESEGTIISFVVAKDSWDKPAIVNSFTSMGRSLARNFGSPMKILLIDEILDTKKEIVIE